MIGLKRSFDPERANYLVNHPSVRPHVGGDVSAAIDLAAFVAERQNVFLDGEHGGFAFTWSAPRTYEVHTFILPEGRGEWAAEFAELARDWMGDNFADHLWTRVHPEAVNVRNFTLKAGFKPAGTNTLDLGAGPVAYDLFDWRPECQQD